jgi:hypothetical protein
VGSDSMVYNESVFADRGRIGSSLKR